MTQFQKSRFDQSLKRVVCGLAGVKATTVDALVLDAKNFSNEKEVLLDMEDTLWSALISLAGNHPMKAESAAIQFLRHCKSSDSVFTPAFANQIRTLVFQNMDPARHLAVRDQVYRQEAPPRTILQKKEYGFVPIDPRPRAMGLSARDPFRPLQARPVPVRPSALGQAASRAQESGSPADQSDEELAEMEHLKARLNALEEARAAKARSQGGGERFREQPDQSPGKPLRRERAAGRDEEYPAREEQRLVSRDREDPRRFNGEEERFPSRGGYSRYAEPPRLERDEEFRRESKAPRFDRDEPRRYSQGARDEDDGDFHDSQQYHDDARYQDERFETPERYRTPQRADKTSWGASIANAAYGATTAAYGAARATSAVLGAASSLVRGTWPESGNKRARPVSQALRSESPEAVMTDDLDSSYRKIAADWPNKTPKSRGSTKAAASRKITSLEREITQLESDWPHANEDDQRLIATKIGQFQAQLRQALEYKAFLNSLDSAGSANTLAADQADAHGKAAAKRERSKSRPPAAREPSRPRQPADREPSRPRPPAGREPSRPRTDDREVARGQSQASRTTRDELDFWFGQPRGPPRSDSRGGPAAQVDDSRRNAQPERGASPSWNIPEDRNQRPTSATSHRAIPAHSDDEDHPTENQGGRRSSVAFAGSNTYFGPRDPPANGGATERKFGGFADGGGFGEAEWE